MINSDSISLVDLNISISEKSAKLRGGYSFLKTPDAIQLATAIEFNANYFITNDKRLKDIAELKVLVLDELIQ